MWSGPDDLKPLLVSISTLKELPGNPRKGDVDAVARSYETFGQRKPIVAKRDGTVIAGNHQFKAAQKLGWDEIAVVWVDDDDQTALAFALADNRVGDLGTYDDALLIEMIEQVQDEALRLSAGWGEQDLEFIKGADVVEKPKWTDDFPIFPASVLMQRSPKWQARRRYWMERIPYQSTGRSEGLTLPESGKSGFYDQKTKIEKELRRKLSTAEFTERYWVPGKTGLDATGTSVFDPVLAEIAISWFSGPGQQILDPFAGGSVRGLVSGLLGRNYLGVDLSQSQIEQNEIDLSQTQTEGRVTWLVGNSLNVLPSLSAEFDLLFSCPPYYDLEKYSTDPEDISNMTWGDFIDVYGRIIGLSVALLKPDSFICWVVGEVRDKTTGLYRHLVPETIKIFEREGASFYNDVVLVSPFGAVGMRAGEGFRKSRKVGKVHQNVLVFVKGDPVVAASKAGTVIIDEEEEDE